MNRKKILKQKQVNDFWEKEVCGTRFSQKDSSSTNHEQIRDSRYRVESYIKEFAFEAKDAINWLPESSFRSALFELPDFVLSRLY